MKRNVLLFTLLLLTINSNVFSQFDSLIFQKEFYLDYQPWRQNILALGDQNQDGYDDFLVYHCEEERAYIFFGGNTVDTIPDFYFDFNNSARYPDKLGIYPIDINDDDIKDMFCIENRYPEKNIVYIYFGGSTISSQPDITFTAPWRFGSLGKVLKDFNGDGRSELVLYDPNLPNTDKQFGCYYFYNTGSVFDTIPDFVMCGDSVDSVRYDWGVDGMGDLNGDGLTDFSFIGYTTENGIYRYFRRFYLGNTEWDLTPDAVYFNDEHLFDTELMKLLYDLNNDGKADIVIHDYGFYPYYYLNAILKGSFPIDTIPDFGLNTQNEGIYVDGIVELGDVNGDGFNDFMTSTHIFGYQNIKLWLGGRRIHEIADRTWYGNSLGFGRTYGAVGDINGDGTDDIAIGQITYVGGGDCTPGKIYIINGDTAAHADTVTSVIDDNPIPSGYEIYEPFPNPFNPSTKLEYVISRMLNVEIRVYDSLGKEIATLLNEEREPGKHEIVFNADKYKLSSGVYFINIKIKKGGETIISETKKVTLLK